MAPVRLLNWRHYKHSALPASGVLCGTTTPLRSHADEPVHNVCGALERGAPRPDPFGSDPPKGGTTDHACPLTSRWRAQ